MERVELIGQIESQLAGRGELTERRVLDGDGYFIDGHLVVAVMGSDLCVDVGRQVWDAALASDGVRPLLFADQPVPGWVMITLMSAVLVAALLALAGPALEGLFNQAMDKVGQ